MLNLILSVGCFLSLPLLTVCKYMNYFIHFASVWVKQYKISPLHAAFQLAAIKLISAKIQQIFLCQTFFEELICTRLCYGNTLSWQGHPIIRANAPSAARGVMMSLSPLSMVFSALQALLHPVDAYQQPPSNGRMQCIPTD